MIEYSVGSTQCISLLLDGRLDPSELTHSESMPLSSDYSSQVEAGVSAFSEHSIINLDKTLQNEPGNLVCPSERSVRGSGQIQYCSVSTNSSSRVTMADE